jgi:hypothetical protein
MRGSFPFDKLRVRMTVWLDKEFVAEGNAGSSIAFRFLSGKATTGVVAFG